MRLLLLPEDTDAAAIELTLDDDGGIAARRTLSPPPPGATPPAAALPGHRVIVPGTAVRALWLALPSRNPAQAIAAARLALEDDVADDVATLHVAIEPAARPDAPRCVLVVAHAQVQAWLARCAALGVRADALLPDSLLLPPGEGDAAWVAAWQGRVLVRGERLAFSAEPALAETLLDGQPQRPLAEDAVEATLARHAAQAGPDLLQGPYARRDRKADARRRRLQVLALLALLSPALVPGALALRHALAAQWLQSRAVERLAAHEPALATASGDAAAAAVATRVAQATWPDTLAHQAGTLFAAVAQSPDLSLDSLAIERGQPLQAGVHHRDAGALEALRARLGEAGYEVIVLDTQPAGQAWRSEVGMEGRR